MSRLILATLALLLAATASSAADLPVGKWSVAFEDRKGELVIKEVGRDGKITGTMLGDPIEGTWNGETLAFKRGGATVEASLVEEVAKDQTKYTLTGFYSWKLVSTFTPEPFERTIRRGWYAQKVVKDDDQIKAEVKGTVVCKDTSGAYVRVYRDKGFGLEEETRVYFYLSEGEWKHWKNVLTKLNGQAVTVTATLGQIRKGSKTSIPEGALYFEEGFVVKTATGTFK